jgi:murein DD-endopeptidase MepM/ murein hydrolase activator NlpD
VISVVDGLDEVQPQVEMDPEHPAGNHVVIQVAENEYLFIAHMQPGSIQVKAGDHVTAGQVIGLTGNSGNTSEPHIHIHLQDTPELVVTDDSGQITGLSDAQGLPLTFSNYLANGEPAELGEPLGGQFVQIAP